MDQFSRLTPLLQSLTEKGPAGCACSIYHKGELKYQECFGYADKESKTPITPDNLYRIYSMTKVITCTAALKLYERGLFQLNDPVAEYLPEFREPMVYRYTDNNALYSSPAVSPVLIKNLFTMTSGLTYDEEDTETGRQISRKLAEWKAEGYKYDVRAFSKMLAAIPLSFDPGTHWRYSLSHDVLAALVEAVSGKKFGLFLKEEIFDPLGMKDTFHRLPDDKRHRLCSFYRRSEDGSLTKSDEMDEHIHPGDTFESGGSGLLSTLGDYQRFIRMLKGNGELDGVRILGRKTIDLMATNHLSPVQQTDYKWTHHAGYGYGLGVRVMTDPVKGGCNGTIGEFGWSGMLGTWMLIDRKEDLTVVYMQQMFPHMEEYSIPRIRNTVYGAI